MPIVEKHSKLDRARQDADVVRRRQYAFAVKSVNARAVLYRGIPSIVRESDARFHTLKAMSREQ